jgi:hypothetical protein
MFPSSPSWKTWKDVEIPSLNNPACELSLKVDQLQQQVSELQNHIVGMSILLQQQQNGGDQCGGGGGGASAVAYRPLVPPELKTELVVSSFDDKDADVSRVASPAVIDDLDIEVDAAVENKQPQCQPLSTVTMDGQFPATPESPSGFFDPSEEQPLLHWK